VSPAATGQKKASGAKLSTAQKQPAKKRPAPRKKPEIWRCHVDWVRYQGVTYNRGDTITVQPDVMDHKQRVTLGKYFTITKTESVAMTSGPVEILAEGTDHGSN